MNADKKSFDQMIGGRIQLARLSKGWNQSTLAIRCGIDQARISKYERGKIHITEGPLAIIARALEVDVEWLTNSDAVRAGYLDDTNPKPLRIGDTKIDDVHLIHGNHIEPLEISIRYRHDRLVIPHRLREVYARLAAQVKEAAASVGRPYYNGPTARLLRISEEKTDQLPDGREQRRLILELAPLSWEEFTILNKNLDEPITPGGGATIRSEYADRRALFQNGPDLRWCDLSNMLSLAMIPITTDGFGLIQHRSRHGVSVDPGRLTSGIAENIHRYLDEAVPDNLGRALNPRTERNRTDVDAYYRPTGVPSPVLTALRGLKEEVSTELYRMLKDSLHRIKFLNLIFDLHGFHPMLTGIVELGLQRSEVERLLQEYPGRDHPEFTSMLFVPLDPSEKHASRLLRRPTDWVRGGLSAFISAIKFFQRDQK